MKNPIFPPILISAIFLCWNRIKFSPRHFRSQVGSGGGLGGQLSGPGGPQGNGGPLNSNSDGRYEAMQVWNNGR